jgi:hypothetical protein
MEKENIKDRLQQYEDTLRNFQKEMKERTEYLLQQTAQVVHTSRKQDAAQQAGVSRMVVRLPPFWSEQPAMWFAQAEAQFTLAGISTENTKFCYIISKLDYQYATVVEDIICSPPETHPHSDTAGRVG